MLFVFYNKHRVTESSTNTNTASLRVCMTQKKKTTTSTVYDVRDKSQIMSKSELPLWVQLLTPQLRLVTSHLKAPDGLPTEPVRRSCTLLIRWIRWDPAGWWRVGIWASAEEVYRCRSRRWRSFLREGKQMIKHGEATQTHVHREVTNSEIKVNLQQTGS